MQSDRTMFEIYRESDYGRKWRVVYFTELGEHNKEAEIARAMAGEHLHDGFISNYHKDEAKDVIARFIEGLNRGEAPDISRLRSELESFGG
jgi:hypothetical protein